MLSLKALQTSKLFQNTILIYTINISRLSGSCCKSRFYVEVTQHLVFTNNNLMFKLITSRIIVRTLDSADSDSLHECLLKVLFHPFIWRHLKTQFMSCHFYLVLHNSCVVILTVCWQVQSFSYAPPSLCTYPCSRWVRKSCRFSLFISPLNQRREPKDVNHLNESMEAKVSLQA